MSTPHKCPVCDGAVVVSRHPWVAGDVPTCTAYGTETHPCKACNGTGVVWEPQFCRGGSLK